MARGRMISRTLGSSRRFSALANEAGALTCFARLLYVLCVTHADDFGRMEGDPFTIRHRVFPIAPESEQEFATALQALDTVGLISWYDVGDRKIIEICQFQEHQQGLHRRTQSKFPDPPGQTPVSPVIPVTTLEPSDAVTVMEAYAQRHFDIRKQPYMPSRIQIEKDLEVCQQLVQHYAVDDVKRIMDAFLQIKDDHPKMAFLKGGQRTMPTLRTKAADIAKHLKIKGVDSHVG